MVMIGFITGFAGSGGFTPASAADEAPPPAKALTIMAAAIPCSDLDRSIAFYTKGLGLTSNGRMDMQSIIEAPLTFPGGGPYLVLVKRKTESPAADSHGGPNRIVLAVPDIKALEAKLVAAGYHLNAPIVENPKYHVSVGQLDDPDGNHVELVQRSP
jgi:predicted enzyme related to lactoylglutathione lyase